MSVMILANGGARTTGVRARTVRWMTTVRRFAVLLVRDETAAIADYANWIIGLAASLGLAAIMWPTISSSFGTYTKTQTGYMTQTGVTTGTGF